MSLLWFVEIFNLSFPESELSCPISVAVCIFCGNNSMGSGANHSNRKSYPFGGKDLGHVLLGCKNCIHDEKYAKNKAPTGALFPRALRHTNIKFQEEFLFTCTLEMSIPDFELHTQDSCSSELLNRENLLRHLLVVSRRHKEIFL